LGSSPRGHRDYASALQELDHAQQSLPNSAYVAIAQAAVARRQGGGTTRSPVSNAQRCSIRAVLRRSISSA
jgi:hypothetical protein